MTNTSLLVNICFLPFCIRVIKRKGCMINMLALDCPWWIMDTYYSLELWNYYLNVATTTSHGINRFTLSSSLSNNTAVSGNSIVFSCTWNENKKNANDVFTREYRNCFVVGWNIKWIFDGRKPKSVQTRLLN